jgi:GH24 family phage-related lysozyme (muramidase)
MTDNDPGEAYTQRNEGRRLVPYDDKTGLAVLPGQPVRGTLTCGFGHAGPDVIAGESWTPERAESVFAVDYAIAKYGARRDVAAAYFDAAAPWRQYALIDICFEVGAGGLKKFHHLIEAIAAGDWGAAAIDEWQSALPRGRAARNEHALATGEEPSPPLWG